VQSTRGTGTPMQAKVTVAGGTVTAIIGTSNVGSWTVAPPDTSEPMTGVDLTITGLVLQISIGSDQSFWPCDAYLTRPERMTGAQTQLKGTLFLWGDRGLGPVEGMITAWGKNPNDPKGPVTTTAGATCRTQFRTYLYAIGSTIGCMMWTLGAALRDDPVFAAVRAKLVTWGFTVGSAPGTLGWADLFDVFGYDTSPWDAFSGTNLTTDVPINTDVAGQPSVWHHARCITSFVSAASIVSAGTGGTPGAAVLSGTTGTGTQVQLNCTIGAGGTLQSIDSIAEAGLYTIKPDSPAVEPLSGGGFTSAPTVKLTLINKADALFPDNSVNGTFKVCQNKAILDQARVVDMTQAAYVDEIAVDFEMNDNRNLYFAPDGVTDLLVVTAQLLGLVAHAVGKKVGGLADPVVPSRSGSQLSITPANVAAIMGADGLDWINIVADNVLNGSDNTSFLAEQHKVFKDAGVPGSKMCMQFSVGGPGQEISEANARATRQYMIDNGFGRTYIANGLGTPGGDCTGGGRNYNQRLGVYAGIYA